MVNLALILSLQAQNLPFQQILPTLIYLCYRPTWTAFTDHGTGSDIIIMLISLFLVRFSLTFICLLRVVD